MSYHDLSECTLSPEERVAEKNKICAMIEGQDKSMLSDTERKFLRDIRLTVFVTVKQLFWLRDIKDKVL